MRAISFPFRLDGTGAVATVEQDSDAEVEEQIALATLTRTGERIQVPTFGIADPVFSGFQAGALQRHLIDFGPNITIQSVKITPTVDGREEVVIDWTRVDQTRKVPPS